MNILKVFNKKIEDIIQKEEALTILLIGSGATKNEKDFHKLKDIDLLIITNQGGFEREVVEIDNVKFDISYISFDALKKIVSEGVPFIINALKRYKCIYNKCKDVTIFLNKVKLISLKPKTISKEEIDYIRFSLFQSYEDILARKNDEGNYIFLTNNLFKDILTSYFKLNNFWVPKDKKILKELKAIDCNLYKMSKGFLKENNNYLKVNILKELIEYLLEPFGGVKRYWEKGRFPLK